MATFPINGYMEILLFLGSLLVEFIDGVKFIKKNIHDVMIGYRFSPQNPDEVTLRVEHFQEKLCDVYVGRPTGDLTHHCTRYHEKSYKV